MNSRFHSLFGARVIIELYGETHFLEVDEKIRKVCLISKRYMVKLGARKKSLIQDLVLSTSS